MGELLVWVVYKITETEVCLSVQRKDPMESQRQKKQNGGMGGAGREIQSTDRMFSVGQEEHLFPEIGRHVKVDLPYFDD